MNDFDMEEQLKVLNTITDRNLEFLYSLSNLPSEKTILKDVLLQRNLANMIAIRIDNKLSDLKSYESLQNIPLSDQFAKRNYILEDAINIIMQQVSIYTGYQKGDCYLIVDKDRNFPKIGNYKNNGVYMQFFSALGHNEDYSQTGRKRKGLISETGPDIKYILNTGNWIHIYSDPKSYEKYIKLGIFPENQMELEEKEYNDMVVNKDPTVDGYKDFSDYHVKSLFPIRIFDQNGNMEIAGGMGFDRLKDHDPRIPIPDYKLWLTQNLLDSCVNLIINSKLVQEIVNKNTELVKAYSDLESETVARIRAEKLAERDALAAQVSHDIKNKGQGTKSSITLARKLLEQNKPELAAQKLANAESGIQEILNISEKFESLVPKTTTTTTKLNYEPIQITTHLDNIISDYNDTFNLKGIKITKDYQYNGTINYDKKLMESAITNIIINSIEAIEKNKTKKEYQPEITIKTYQENKLSTTHSLN
ncbi:MAG: hypothetical protein QXG00_01565 [Candidatus Woesearchaeota archaeon]